MSCAGFAVGYVSIDAFQCSCAPGYDGALCDQDKDECASVPCRNSGQCLDSRRVSRVAKDTFDCKCIQGWRGDTCEEDVNECEDEPCAIDGFNMTHAFCVDSTNNTETLKCATYECT